jgi:hypothetical protein
VHFRIGSVQAHGTDACTAGALTSYPPKAALSKNSYLLLFSLWNFGIITRPESRSHEQNKFGHPFSVLINNRCIASDF